MIRPSATLADALFQRIAVYQLRIHELHQQRQPQSEHQEELGSYHKNEALIPKLHLRQKQQLFFGLYKMFKLV